MKKVYKITKDGNITGLWDDLLSVIPGEKKVSRASHVEYDETSQRWGVKIYIMEKLRIVKDTFAKRSDALAHEITICNKLISGYPIEGFLAQDM